MRKSFITLGLLIALMPQLGIYQLWKDIFFTIAGLLVVLLVIAPRSAPREKIKKEPKTFIENSPTTQENNETSSNY